MQRSSRGRGTSLSGFSLYGVLPVGEITGAATHERPGRMPGTLWSSSHQNPAPQPSSFSSAGREVSMAFGDLVKYARTLYLGGALAVEEDQSEVFFRDRSMSLTLDPPAAESLVLAYETAAAARVVAVAGETPVDAGRSAPSWDWIPVHRTISPTAGACSTRPSGVPRRVPRSAAREVAGVGASIRRAKPLVGTFALSVPGSARDRATAVFPRATPATTPRGDTCRRRKGKRSLGGSRMARRRGAR